MPTHDLRHELPAKSALEIRRIGYSLDPVGKNLSRWDGCHCGPLAAAQGSREVAMGAAVDPGWHSDWLTRSEAARYARVSVSKIDRARRYGELESRHVDRRVLIH